MTNNLLKLSIVLHEKTWKRTCVLRWEYNSTLILFTSSNMAMRKVRKPQRIVYYKALINRVKTSDTIYPYEAKQEKKIFCITLKWGKFFVEWGAVATKAAPQFCLRFCINIPEKSIAKINLNMCLSCIILTNIMWKSEIFMFYGSVSLNFQKPAISRLFT